MKKMLVLAFVSLMVTQSFGAVVKSAKIDAEKKNILIDVAYGGGCGDHDFSLKVGACQETYPARCEAELIHKSNDGCEAYINTTIAISLEKAGLTHSQFDKASLTITGDYDWQRDGASQVHVTLP